MNIRRVERSLIITIGLLLAFWTGFATVAPTKANTATRGVHLEQPRPSAFAPVAITEQVVLTPAKDNTLYEGITDLKSNGAGAHLFAGKNADNLLYRGLLAFDLAGQVPSDAVIVSATLKLNLSVTATGTQSISLHRVQSNWGEGASDATGSEARGAPALTGDATWVHTFFSTTQWIAPGGDYLPTPSATTTVGQVGFYTWTSPTLISDVQSWVNNASTNFGWILLGNEVDRSSAKRFDSRQNGNPLLRPELSITYTPGVAKPNALYLPLVQRTN